MNPRHEEKLAAVIANMRAWGITGPRVRIGEQTAAYQGTLRLIWLMKQGQS